MYTRSGSVSRFYSRTLVAAAAAAALLAPGAMSGHSTVRAQSGPATIQIEAQPVYQGCNSIVVMAPFGTVWPDIIAHFSDPSTVSAIWKYNNDLQRYQALYFADPDALLDGLATTTAFVQSMFVCVSADGSVG